MPPWVETTILAALLVATVGSGVQVRDALRGEAGRHARGRGGRLVFGLLAGVVTLLFLNQLVVASYFAAVGRPDTLVSFPPGWFHVLDTGVTRAAGEFLATRPALLEVASWSVLRFNAFFELPFALLAALGALWLVGPQLAGLAVRRVPWLLACASWTATFVVLELMLSNPWTGHDVVLRVLAGLACLVAQPLFSRALGPGAWRGRVRGLRTAVESAVGVALLGGSCVLVAFLTLVYNLGDAPWVLWLLVPALGALAVLVRIIERDAPSGDGDGPFRMLDMAVSRFAVWFFPVAIPLRYGWSSLLTKLLLAGLVLLAWATAVSEDSKRLGQHVVVGLVALGVAWTDLFGVLDGLWLVWPDLLMLQRATLFVAIWTLGTAAAGRVARAE